MLSWIKKIILTKFVTKVGIIYPTYKNKLFYLLDVGCGNHSASRIKTIFPKCNYSGIDREMYNNDGEDFNVMNNFYKIDLTCNDLTIIPDNFFDVILMCHVIEHIENGIQIIEQLSKKIKKGGYIYIEFPSIKTLSFPLGFGALHFSDDQTHKKLYDIKEIANTLLNMKFRILKAGKRRNKYRIFFSPFLIFYELIKYKRFVGGAIWDIVGFVEFVYAEKCA
jgi:SAM-dependent methyltransferase